MVALTVLSAAVATGPGAATLTRADTAMVVAHAVHIIDAGVHQITSRRRVYVCVCVCVCVRVFARARSSPRQRGHPNALIRFALAEYLAAARDALVALGAEPEAQAVAEGLIAFRPGEEFGTQLKIRRRACEPR